MVEDIKPADSELFQARPKWKKKSAMSVKIPWSGKHPTTSNLGAIVKSIMPFVVRLESHYWPPFEQADEDLLKRAGRYCSEAAPNISRAILRNIASCPHRVATKRG
jgi:hypothetical protein